MLDAKPQGDEVRLEKEMIGKSVAELAELIKAPSPFLISLGFAALNAGNGPDPAKVDPANFPADNLIADLGSDKTVGLVGEFPFVESLKERVGKFHLFELRPVPGSVPRDQWETVLAGLDVLAITGTALLTRSMTWFLSRAPQAEIVVVGPTTVFSPVLFDHGVNYLCGSVVTDKEKVGKGVKEGLPFKMVKRNGGIIFTQWQRDQLNPIFGI